MKTLSQHTRECLGLIEQGFGDHIMIANESASGVAHEVGGMSVQHNEDDHLDDYGISFPEGAQYIQLNVGN